MKSNHPKQDSLLLGLGLDNKDGHKRLTKGDNVLMVGGSEETHERMTENGGKTVYFLYSQYAPVYQTSVMRLEFQ